MPIKIATWNINGVRARLDNLVAWLKESNPDIVGLQEIKTVDEGFPRAEIEALGYHIETHGQKGFNGVALLSKIRPDEVNRGLPGGDGDEQARFIEGVFSVEGGVIRFCCLYLPNGNPPEDPVKYPYKLSWMDRLVAFAEDRLVVVAAQDDALARMRQVRLADLAGRHFIGLSGSALQDHVTAQAAAMGMQLRYRVRLRTFDGICRMAGAGAGIGIVPRTAARRMKRTSGIAIIRLADGWALRRLSVCIRAGTELSAPAQSLFRHLTQGTPAA